MAEIVTLARPYAKAAFSAAVDNNALASWSSALGVLAQISQVQKVVDLIDSPNLTAADKSAALKGICGDELLARDVTIASSVDQSLLGGIFIRAGDTVIDASVRGRLEKLASAIGA